MFDRLTTINRLLLCLLASVGLHAGLIFSEWGVSPSRPLAVRSPVEVSRVEIAARNPSVAEERPALSEATDNRPSAASRPAVAAKSNLPQEKASQTAQEVKSAEPVRHVVPDVAPSQVSPRIHRTSEQQATQVKQEVLDSRPLKAAAPGLSDLPATAEAREEESGQGEGLARNDLIEAVPAYRSNPLPEYPSLARQRRWEGVVWLQVDVTAEGRVSDVRVENSSGHAILDRSASRTVGRWRFVPATRAGLPVDSRVRVPVHFRLEEG